MHIYCFKTTFKFKYILLIFFPSPKFIQIFPFTLLNQL